MKNAVEFNRLYYWNSCCYVWWIFKKVIAKALRNSTFKGQFGRAKCPGERIFRLSESLEYKILATMLSPPRYLGLITNLPFWATWSLKRIQNVDFFSPFMLGYVNKSNSSSTFPWILKLADITAVYKKDSRYEKGNYRPISFLPNLSKIFENVLYDQIFSFFENFSQNIELVSGKASW